jgi:hypothetical protein
MYMFNHKNGINRKIAKWGQIQKNRDRHFGGAEWGDWVLSLFFVGNGLK